MCLRLCISSITDVLSPYVAVKPEYVKVFKEEDSAEISNSALIGPFEEGQELKLSCQSGGGKPIPDITWWNGTHKLPGEYNRIAHNASLARRVLIEIRPNEFRSSAHSLTSQPMPSRPRLDYSIDQETSELERAARSVDRTLRIVDLLHSSTSS